MDPRQPAPAGAAQPVAVAALTRTSTLDLQDPVASFRRQYRSISDWLPAGWYIAAVYSDVESGATDLDRRSMTDSWRVLTDAGLPRDGGMADLLAEAASPSPRFSVVVVEDIERASRDTYDSLRLERRLGDQGIPLLATDEPADVTGLNATAVLVRRVKQGVAEWYRIQVKTKAKKGLEDHSMAGYNIGPVPYGYKPDRTPHPVRVKAGQGRTKTRLAVDPDAGPWVTQAFEWRVLENLSREAIALRLDAHGVPSPDGKGWAAAAVGKILANPKYTGYMVYGRTKNAGKSQRAGERKIRAVPPSEWTWSAEPSHPALVSREMWDAAQLVAKGHEGVRDPEVPTTRGGRRYPLRSRVFCAQCGHRMSGNTRPGYKDGPSYAYYLCPNNAKSARVARNCPEHVRSALREKDITAALGGFLDRYVLGHDRKAMLRAHLPATAADEAARRDAQTVELTRRLARNEASQKALIAELAQGAADATPAGNAYRARIRDHYNDLYGEAAALQAQLDAIAAQTASASDPALIEQLPYAPGVLGRLPDDLQEALYAALGIQITYRPQLRQVTIHATLTDSTPGIVTALLAAPRTGGGTPQNPAAPREEPGITAPLAVAGCPRETGALFGDPDTATQQSGTVKQQKIEKTFGELNAVAMRAGTPWISIR
jgi:site-specific DNA recombinase